MSTCSRQCNMPNCKHKCSIDHSTTKSTDHFCENEHTCNQLCNQGGYCSVNKHEGRITGITSQWYVVFVVVVNLMFIVF
jgi:hypothetical protein